MPEVFFLGSDRYSKPIPVPFPPIPPRFPKRFEDFHPDPGRAAVVIMEERLGHKVTVPELVKAIQDKRGHLRQMAVGALREMGPDARDAISPLIEALKDQPELSKMLDDKPAKAKPGDDGYFEKQESAHKWIAAALALWQVGCEGSRQNGNNRQGCNSRLDGGYAAEEESGPIGSSRGR